MYNLFYGGRVVNLSVHKKMAASTFLTPSSLHGLGGGRLLGGIAPGGGPLCILRLRRILGLGGVLGLRGVALRRVAWMDRGVVV